MQFFCFHPSSRLLSAGTHLPVIQFLFNSRITGASDRTGKKGVHGGASFPRRQGRCGFSIRVYARSQFLSSRCARPHILRGSGAFSAVAAQQPEHPGIKKVHQQDQDAPCHGGAHALVVDHQEGVWPLHQSHQVQPQQPGAVEHRRHQRQPDIPPGQPGLRSSSTKETSASTGFRKWWKNMELVNRVT